MVHFITPGDSVDIVSSSFIDGTEKVDCRIVAENITVLSVGQRLEEWSNFEFEENYPLSVTILATTGKALQILEAAQKGEIHFLARGLHLIPLIPSKKALSDPKENLMGY
jgi:Flp pilus assembly protein CpaB